MYTQKLWADDQYLLKTKMILKREKFEYKNEVLIERLLITPPFRHEVLFQNEGCFIHIKGADTRVLSSNSNLKLTRNQAVLLNCGHYFVEWLRKSDRAKIEVIAFHLYPQILKKLYKNELPKSFKKQPAEIQATKVVPDHTVSKFIDSLSFYFQNPSLISEDLLELKIKELILLLIQTKSADSVLSIISGLYEPRISNLRKVIELHLYENLSVQELATLCNLSLSSFKREFRAQYEDSPIHYINRKKVERAQELLKESNLSVGEISYEIGIHDPQYFSRLFKKIAGKSPSAFRKQF